MDGEEMIAEQALLFVPDPVGFENVPPGTWRTSLPATRAPG